MKQHITYDQLYELSETGRENLRDWWKPQSGDLATSKDNSGFIVYNFSLSAIKESDLPFLSIGQMIEFLDEHEDSSINALCFDKGEFEWHLYTLKGIPGQSKPSIRSVELCDALWNAVKEKLETDPL